MSSGQLTYVSQINWAITYLHRALCLNRPQRAHYAINNLGKKLQAQHPDEISQSDLAKFAQDHGIKYPSGVAQRKLNNEERSVDKQEAELTPTEQMETGLVRLCSRISADLLERLHNNAPVLFELGLPASGGHIIKLLVSFLQVKQGDHDPAQTEQER
ncbi:hypothetical protein LZ605_22360 (plasmid) [Stenotrophomonas maltophilia]|nr:hypothetical protein LZ605_22360 [Stenotrophomonas maltophilia]